MMKDFRYNYIHSGERIAKARKEMKYTQKELAEMLNLCKYLEVSTDYILFGYDTDINYVIQKKLKRLHPMQMKFVERIMDEIIPLVQCMYEEGVLADDKTMPDKTES